MTLRRTALVILTAAALATMAAAPAFAAKNKGITASLQKAMATTANAFCDGMSAWADVVQRGGEPPSAIPRTDRQISDSRSAAQHIRDTGRAMGCLI